MAVRTLVPIMALGALGCAAASLGIGYGLGQYTISGMDPFHATVRGSDWRPERLAAAPPPANTATWKHAGLFDPEPSRY